MKTIATIIGYAFIAAWIIGLMPGMNFHVYFGGDQFVYEAHQRAAEKIATRLPHPQ